MKRPTTWAIVTPRSIPWRRSTRTVSESIVVRGGRHCHENASSRCSRRRAGNTAGVAELPWAGDRDRRGGVTGGRSRPQRDAPARDVGPLLYRWAVVRQELRLAYAGTR